MRSRISLFNRTVLKKNVTRYAPAWGLYSLGLMMMLVTQLEGGRASHFASNMAYTLESMGIVNLIYALVSAQLVYGDLYNTRMCNALHALHLRRETWFFTNLLSGLLFSLVPNLVITLLSIAAAPQCVLVFLLWLAVMTLQYLFFFGLATLCAYITGQRFAMALIYGIVNFFAVIANWLITIIYIPLLYGLVPGSEIFLHLTPVVRMVQDNYIRVDSALYGIYGGGIGWEFREGWGYLGICAAVGLGFLALALHCYRKRDLEKAGDFMTIRGLGPVFLTVYTLCLGCFCHWFFSELLGHDTYLFLILGFGIGFFTGQMLLKRTVRVFRWKTIGGFALFLAAFGISFGLTLWDPLGVTRWIPDPEKVAHVSINTDSTYYYYEDGTVWNDIRQIEEIQTVHRYAIEHRETDELWSGGVRLVNVTLIYELKSGRTVTREYKVAVSSEAGKILRKYLSSPEYVLGWVFTGESRVTLADFQDPGSSIMDPEDIRSLLDAILADCKEGNLPQSWDYLDAKGNIGWLTLDTVTAGGLRYYREIRFSAEAKNLLEWMKAHEISPEKWG